MSFRPNHRFLCTEVNSSDGYPITHIRHSWGLLRKVKNASLFNSGTETHLSFWFSEKGERGNCSHHKKIRRFVCVDKIAAIIPAARQHRDHQRPACASTRRKARYTLHPCGMCPSVSVYSFISFVAANAIKEAASNRDRSIPASPDISYSCVSSGFNDAQLSAATLKLQTRSSR